MATQELILLGDARLYDAAEKIVEADLSKINEMLVDLHDTLLNFQQFFGKAEGIYGSQIGFPKQIIYTYIGESPKVYLNPVLTFGSDAKKLVWEHSPSFLNLEVLVERYEQCTLTYDTIRLETKTQVFSGETAFLIQQLVDGMNGIPSTMKIADSKGYKIVINNDTK